MGVKSKYDEIISSLNSLARSYNRSLQAAYQNFKIKIGNHKASLEANIKRYIQRIRGDLTKHSCCVKEFIESIKNIESQITKFEENYRKIGPLRSYNDLKSITKHDFTGVQTDISTINQIFKTLFDYRNASNSFNRYKNLFSPILTKLKFYSELISKVQIPDTEELRDYTADAHSISGTLEGFKAYIDKFDPYMKHVKTLGDIADHIKTMKTESSKVHDKIKPHLKDHIDSLHNIDFDYSEFEELFKKIQSTTETFIEKFNFANQAIEFNKTLQREFGNLNVTITNYDISASSNNHGQIKNKVESFETNINKEIDKIKKQVNGPTKVGVTCGTKKLEEGNDDLISPVKTCIDSSVDKIKSFIDNTLKDIDLIKQLIQLIQNKKNRSENYLTGIKSKVDGIKALNDSSTKLTQTKEELNKFVKVQQRTKSIICTYGECHYKFKALRQYSSTLDNIITYSNNVITYINGAIDYLKKIGNVDSVTNDIKLQEQKIETIKKIIQNFNSYVKQIITILLRINLNLSRLKSFQCYISVGNNLWKLKDYVKYLNLYVNYVETDLTNLRVIVDKIKKDSYYIDNFEPYMKYFDNYIDCYTSNNNNNNATTKLFVNYLKSIKERLNEIIMVKHLMIKSSSLTRMEKIESKLKEIESSVIELECAIEGVARNLIGCALLSLSRDLIICDKINNNRLINSELII